MPAAPIIIGAAVSAGIASSIGAAIVGAITTATISASVATAIGTGVIAGSLTAIQGGSSSDIFKSAVLSGAGSYVGSQVASKVTSAVAAETGASLIDLEPALRGLSGEGITASGAAAITAGNVAGQAVNAAITGRPIGEGALLGLATSIPTALSSSQDFRSLDPIAQNVISSSLQASTLGTDVGTAALTSLVVSSDIVAKAIKEIPNGEQFIKQNPIFAKYVVDSVSSALVAKLTGADVSESVIASLARTTGDVLAREFENAQNSKLLEDTREQNEQATLLREQATEAQNELTQLLADNKRDVDYFNTYLEIYSEQKPEFDRIKRRFNSLSKQYDRLATDSEWRDYINQLAVREGLSPEQYIAREANSLENEIIDKSERLNRTVSILNKQSEKLQSVGFFDRYDQLVNDIKNYDAQYNSIVKNINLSAEQLTFTSENLFNNFSNELETTLAPLTAFEETDVTDQDVLAGITPVAPPSDLVAEGGMSVEDQELLNQIQEVAQRPGITGQEGSTELAGPATPSFIDLIDRQNERLVGGPQVSTEVDSGVTITSLRQQVVGTLPDGREYLYTIVIDPDTGERFYEWSTQGAPSAEGIAEEQVLNASRTKPDFQKLFAAPGVPGGAGGDIQTDIENIISGEGLEEVTPTTPTQVETPIVVTEQEQAPTIPAQTVTGGETVQEVTPTQPSAGPVTDQDIIEVIQGETLPETGGEVSTVPVGEATTPIQVEAPTIVAEEGQATVPPSTVAPAEITDQISVVGGEAPADTVAPTDVIAEASVPAGEITDEDIIEIITSEGTPTVTPGEETLTIVGGEATTGGGEETIVLPPETIEGGTTAEQTITGGESGGETVLGGEAGTGGDTVVGGEGDLGEVTLPGGGGEATLPGGGEGEISDEDILNIIGGGGEATLPGGEGEATLPGGGGELPAVTTSGGEGEEDTIFLGGGEGEGAPPTEPEDEDQAILDLIKELEGEEGMEEIPLEEEVTAGETGPRPVITVVPRPRAIQRPGEAAPYRVTGQDESGILGRKQPLFGGDEDLQRAEWNRRSLRLRRLLGL